MSVYYCFGKPGCGKTTYFTWLANSYLKNGVAVYGNVPLKLEGYIYIDVPLCLEKYRITNGIVLIDESSLSGLDNRGYKSFSPELMYFFKKHRHAKVDVYLFSQGYNDADKKIRALVDKVYYIYKPIITGHWVTKIMPVNYGIDIPKAKSHDRTRLNAGEIIEGYFQPSFAKLFAKRIIRKPLYKYFDSFEYDAPHLKPLPPKYRPYHNQEREH